MKPAHNIWDLRDQAKRRLPRAVFEFIERGSEDEHLIRRNRDSLDRLRLTPRSLRDVATRDQSIELFGRKLPTPMIIAPTGTADLLCYRGESAIARAAGEAGIPFTLATSSTTSTETIGKINPGFWMQLYLWDRRDLSWQLVERAGAAGAEAMVLTVDTPMWPNREFNKRNGMANPIRANPTLARHFLGRPAWLATVMGRYALAGGVPQFANYPMEAVVAGGAKKVSRQANSANVTWDDVKELRRRWPKTLLLKGVLSVEDARMAAEHGVDGLVVSNHGGRNFDPSPASIDVLPEIAEAVGDRLKIIFDSGVRRGSDVLKAVALGADAVMIGRATLYGAAAGGQAGASRAIEILKDEISGAMAMLGVTSLGEIDRSYLRRETAAGLDQPY